MARCLQEVQLEDFVVAKLLEGRALLPSVPVNQRKQVYIWLVQLYPPPDLGPAELRLHAEYLVWLVMGLQEGRVLPPFLLQPPAGSLVPLTNLIPRDIYTTVLKRLDEGLRGGRWRSVSDPEPLDSEGDDSGRTAEEDDDDLEIRVDKFYDSMPLPRDGSYCYCAIFAEEED